MGDPRGVRPGLSDVAPLTAKRPSASESPADVYERRLARRRRDAEDDVRVVSGWALGLHVAAAVGFCAGLAVGLLLVMSLLVWAASVVVAVTGGVMTLRRWSLLSAWWIGFGLLAWALVVLELSFLMFAVAFYRL